MEKKHYFNCLISLLCEYPCYFSARTRDGKGEEAEAEAETQHLDNDDGAATATEVAACPLDPESADDNDGADGGGGGEKGRSSTLEQELDSCCCSSSQSYFEPLVDQLFREERENCNKMEACFKAFDKDEEVGFFVNSVYRCSDSAKF